MRLLTVLLNEDEIAQVNAGDEPCEMKPSRPVQPGAVITFVDGAGRRHVHSLAELSGWAHISVRVHQGLACQADCAVTGTETYDPSELLTGQGHGIRFQPFFLPGSKGDANELVGQGLFRRGMHFSGAVTPGSVRLSCECDHCSRSFQVQSFHAGFGATGYMYSGSGDYTLVIDERAPGAPPALGKPDMDAVTALEAILPVAPDGTRFRYMNPFRCPHCHKPYIDFQAHPGLREGEYYGNCCFGAAPIRYEQPEDLR
jgi:hypothetical protein